MNIYSARYVFPVDGPPLPDATVAIDGERIVAVGPRRQGEKVVDLGNVALLPGLVNAHTHLEPSDLTAPLGHEGIGLAEWIRLLMTHRQVPGRDASSAVRRGLDESLRAGTTTLAEMALPDWRVEPFEASPIDATIFLEVIAPTPGREGPALAAAEAHVQRTGRMGLCPHATYSVTPSVLRQCAALSTDHEIPLASHVAESTEEMELLRRGEGPLRELLDQLGVIAPRSPSADYRSMEWLRPLAEGDRAMVIHGNYLDTDEIAFLAERSENVAVVHCPRTHQHFRHARSPLVEMLRAGVFVAVGTDSRASNPDLSVLAELRTIARLHPNISPTILPGLGTACGAKALGLDAEIGTLAPGKRADMVAIALPQRTADPHELLLHADGAVTQTWIRGVAMV